MLKEKDKILLIDGVISEYEADEDFRPNSIKIGEYDIIEAIDDNFKDTRNMVVGVAGEAFSDNLFLDYGWGYSEYTWMDDDILKIGRIDLLKKLRDRLGEKVTMIVTKLPINILEYIN